MTLHRESQVKDPHFQLMTSHIVTFEIQAMKTAILALNGVNIALSYLSHDHY
jgi:hypothetical protein